MYHPSDSYGFPGMDALQSWWEDYFLPALETTIQSRENSLVATTVVLPMTVAMTDNAPSFSSSTSQVDASLCDQDTALEQEQASSPEDNALVVDDYNLEEEEEEEGEGEKDKEEKGNATLVVAVRMRPKQPRYPQIAQLVKAERIEKRGHFVKNWKSRWMTHSVNTLFYFKTDPSTHFSPSGWGRDEKGEFDIRLIESMTIEDVPNPSGQLGDPPWALLTIVNGKGKQMWLRFPTRQGAEAWQKSLGYDMCGMMNKRSIGKPFNYKRRFFTLRHNILSYHKSNSSMEPKNQISLKKYVAVCDESMQQLTEYGYPLKLTAAPKYCSKMIVTPPDLLMFTDTQQLRKKWLANLRYRFHKTSRLVHVDCEVQSHA